MREREKKKKKGNHNERRKKREDQQARIKERNVLKSLTMIGKQGGE